MGYLDNTSITVDAILTKVGRQLLARNDGSFKITQFALGDDEIDYMLFNETHPNGTQYAAEAIENMPLIEAMPDGSNMMQSKLITLARGTSAIPYIRIPGFNQNQGPEVIKGASLTITPQTYNINGNNQAGVESQGYRFTLLDNRLRESFTAAGGGVGLTSETAQSAAGLGTYMGNASPVSTVTNYTNTATAETIVGKQMTFQATTNNALFSSTVTSKVTSLIIEGINTGARITLPLTVKSTT
jgi:hypothetical protein